MKEFVKNIVKDYKDLQIGHFHYLHAHPELSFQEYETNAYIKKTLAEAGVPLQRGIRGTSVVGVLKGDAPGPTIAFRADIDALPVQEETGLEYQSTTPESCMPVVMTPTTQHFSHLQGSCLNTGNWSGEL